jgi:hypothetical protein
MIWNLAAIRQAVRDLSGRKTATQLSDAALDNYINEYYTLILPADLDLEELKGFWSKNTATGVDTLALDNNVLFLKPPYTAGGYPLEVFDDPVRLYHLYPKTGEPYAPARPTAALYQGRSLLLRPGPDAVYEIYCPAVLMPAVLSGAGAPMMDQWGRLIALGAAILIYTTAGQRQQAEDLAGAYGAQRALVQRPMLKKMMDYRGQGRF